MSAHETSVRQGRWQSLYGRASFLASCSCGWEGLERSTRGDAALDALRHSEEAERSS
jgi:hypothetical protein